MKLSTDHKKKLLKVGGMKQLQKLHKKYVTKGAGAMKGSGEGFWGKVGSYFTKAGVDVNDFLKKNKVLSRTAGLAKWVLPAIGLAEFSPVAEVGSEIAESLGYGRVRTVGRKLVKGRGLSTAPLMLGTGAIRGTMAQPGIQGTISNSNYVPEAIPMAFGFNQYPQIGGQVSVRESGPWVVSQNGEYQLSNAALISGKGKIRGRGNMTEFNSVAPTRIQTPF